MFPSYALKTANLKFFATILCSVILLAVISCSTKNHIVIVDEKAGISRDLEYVKVRIQKIFWF